MYLCSAEAVHCVTTDKSDNYLVYVPKKSLKLTLGYVVSSPSEGKKVLVIMTTIR